MDSLAHPLIQLAVVLFGPAGAAWLSVRSALVATSNDLSEIKRDIKEIRDHGNDLRERIVVIETTLGLK
jgi:hypothetical protein